MSDTSLEAHYFRNMVEGLTEAGDRVSLIELGIGTAPSWLGHFPQVKYYPLNAGRKLAYAFALVNLVFLIRSLKIDILHSHLYFSGLMSGVAKVFLRPTRVVYTRHHTSVVRMLGNRLHIAVDKWMAEKADHVVTVSEAARDYMRDVDGINREIEVIYLGFDFTRFDGDGTKRNNVRSEFGFADDNFVIGYIANFAPGKGHIQLVEAFSEIVNAVPSARLLLVGRGHLADVDEAIRQHRIAEKVVLTGWRSDTDACLNAMDVFVQPSLSEAFSQVLVEAMGVGLPVIATKVGGAEEVVENDQNGILIDPDRPEQIVRAALSLYEDCDRRKELGRTARSSVVARFSVERMVNRHFELYKKWLGEKGV